MLWWVMSYFEDGSPPILGELRCVDPAHPVGLDGTFAVLAGGVNAVCGVNTAATDVNFTEVSLGSFSSYR